MQLIQGGRIVRSGGIVLADILIDGEQIIDVLTPDKAQTLPVDNVHVHPADGLLIFPGLIDPHTHLREPGGEHKEDFYTGTCAALAGGVTTVFAMPNTAPAVVDERSLDFALDLASKKAVCDFGLFLGATTTNAKLKRQTPTLQECGLKIYMGSSTGDLLVEDFGSQYEHFENYPPERVIAVHAEHEPAVRYFAQHGLRRPPICAELETARAVALSAHCCQRRLHVCHVSTRREVDIIAEAKARGVPVTCEFSPHHLFLSSDWVRDHVRDEGLPTSCFEMNPPLRTADHVAFLWEQLTVADCIATDHAPHTLDEKRGPKPPMGTPGLETMLPLLLTAAQDGKLSYEDIARLCCEGPAHAFNIAHKGRIARGFDADLTLVDPQAQWRIGDKRLFTKCGWTPFAGWRACGQVKQVFIRGQLAFEDGRMLVERGCGRQIRTG